MIIGLTGKKQNGKSTAAEYLSNWYGFARLNFKDALVEETKKNFPNLLQEMINIYDKTDYDGMNPWTIERLFKEKPPLMRALLQNYGTEVRRYDNYSYWVSKWKEASYGDKNIVCDDVRFMNEADAVIDRGGIIVRIVRTDYKNTDTHSSELEMDHIVANKTITVATGEVDKLYAELDKIIVR